MSTDKLLPCYERELGLLRLSLNEFAGRFPKIATRLSISGGLSEDPQVERLIQSFALIAARLSMKLDDDTPAFTDALLDVMYPHFLRPIPSYSIVQFSMGREVKDMSATTIPRGTAVKAPPVDLIEYRFRTAYDVVLAPVTISQATYSPVVNAPASVKLPPDATGCISITFSCVGAQQLFASSGLKKCRTYIHGEPAFVATLRDSLFLHTARTFLERDGNGVWLPLHDPAVMTEVGYGEDEGLIPTQNNGNPLSRPNRLLSEYVAFPEKFNFVDVNFPTFGLYPAQTHQFTLHLVLHHVRADSKTARVLAALTAANLRLGCTPIINLFGSESKAVPIIDAAPAAVSAYPVTLHARHVASYEVYSIDKVTLTSKGDVSCDMTVCHPFYSLQHSDAKNTYWMAQRNDPVTTKAEGYETGIVIIDSNFKPVEPQNQILNMQLTCTNRDLPTQLPFGSLEGDLMLDEVQVSAALACQIGLLNKLSHAIPVDHERGMQWRLISHLKLNHLSLSQQGLPALKEMLLLYNVTNSAMFDRQVQSLIALTHKKSMQWVAANPITSPHASYQKGIEIQLTINDGNFVDSSMRGFIRVLDHFFALYTHVNSFTQLIVFSDNSGTMICTCEPRPGVIALV